MKKSAIVVMLVAVGIVVLQILSLNGVLLPSGGLLGLLPVTGRLDGLTREPAASTLVFLVAVGLFAHGVTMTQPKGVVWRR